jgi:predicted NBD/HSP70 family sugar kinase
MSEPASATPRTHPSIMKTADPELMRAINRYHVIDVIRRYGPIARVEIVERTDLSRATISAITGGLIDDGIITVQHVDPTEVPGDGAQRGRPRVMLALNGTAYHVVGVKLSLHRISIAVTDFRGDVLRNLIIPVRIARQTPEVVADLVEDGVRQGVADAGLSMKDISGVGIGLPGVIDGVAGVSHWSPVLGLSPVPFATFMRQRLGVPILIENDANLVALAEHWYGHARDVDSFVVVTVEDTIGMGLFIDGKLYRGAHGVGAELGHLKMRLDGPLCRCGRHGCLDTYASDTGVIEAARQAGYLPADDRRPTSELIASVLARAQSGEAGPAALFHTAGKALGLAVANVLNMLNPPLIIISGEGLRAGVFLTSSLIEMLDQESLPALRAATQIIFHPWGDENWARGAATIVLRRIYETPLNSSIG